jgi:hypothetical protein
MYVDTFVDTYVVFQYVCTYVCSIRTLHKVQKFLALIINGVLIYVLATRPYATSVCGLKLLVYEALSY